MFKFEVICWNTEIQEGFGKNVTTANTEHRLDSTPMSAHDPWDPLGVPAHV